MLCALKRVWKRSINQKHSFEKIAGHEKSQFDHDYDRVHAANKKHSVRDAALCHTGSGEVKMAYGLLVYVQRTHSVALYRGSVVL